MSASRAVYALSKGVLPLHAANPDGPVIVVRPPGDREDVSQGTG